MATQKQLAALAKARAARKKNLSKAKPKAKPHKKPIAKKRASNPIKRRGPFVYVLKVVTTTGKVGYYSGNGVTFDDDISKAFTGSKNTIDNFVAMLFMIKPKGIKSLETVKK